MLSAACSKRLSKPGTRNAAEFCGMESILLLEVTYMVRHMVTGKTIMYDEQTRKCCCDTDSI